MAKVKGDVLKDPILKRIVEIIVKELDPDKIILFGSRVRGDYNEHSDYDILVLKRDVKPEERRKLEGMLMIKLLENRIFKYANVDLIVQSPERFSQLKDLPFLVYSDIFKEGVVVYDGEKRRSKKMA